MLQQNWKYDERKVKDIGENKMLESIVISLITGIITGGLVTQIYRKKDEAIEKR